VIIQISTGGAVGASISERLAPLDLKPHMASLNMGSINFGDEVFENKPSDIEAFAKRMLELKIVPEFVSSTRGSGGFGSTGRG
jgi:3-keto-5-aminohexanoate cleavage enzyme